MRSWRWPHKRDSIRGRKGGGPNLKPRPNYCKHRICIILVLLAVLSFISCILWQLFETVAHSIYHLSYLPTYLHTYIPNISFSMRWDKRCSPEVFFIPVWLGNTTWCRGRESRSGFSNDHLKSEERKAEHKRNKTILTLISTFSLSPHTTRLPVHP